MTPNDHSRKEPEKVHCGHECVCEHYHSEEESPCNGTMRVKMSGFSVICPHDTRRSSGQHKVYLVAIADVDTFSLKHACLSEETAHKRFHEVRREIMTENLGMIEHDKEEGIDPTMWIEMNRRLESLTPDGDIKECGERPVIEVMELEP